MTAVCSFACRSGVRVAAVLFEGVPDARKAETGFLMTPWSVLVADGADCRTFVRSPTVNRRRVRSACAGMVSRCSGESACARNRYRMSICGAGFDSSTPNEGVHGGRRASAAARAVQATARLFFDRRRARRSPRCALGLREAWGRRSRCCWVRRSRARERRERVAAHHA